MSLQLALKLFGILNSFIIMFKRESYDHVGKKITITWSTRLGAKLVLHFPLVIKGPEGG